MEDLDKRRKLSDAKTLGNANDTVGARSRALGHDIALWIQEYLLLVGRRAIDQLPGLMAAQRNGVLAKASLLPPVSTLRKISQEDRLKARLQSILMTHGLRQVSDAAGRSMTQIGVPFSIPIRTQQAINRGESPDVIMRTLPSSFPDRQREALSMALERNRGTNVNVVTAAARRDLASQTIGTVVVPSDAVSQYEEQATGLLQRMIPSIQNDITSSVRSIVADSLRESPQVSAGEVARRIRNQWHGDAITGPLPSPLELGPARDSQPGQPALAVPTTQAVRGTRQFSTEEGVAYAFSGERAMLIARTELGAAREIGTVVGYEAAGVVAMKWLAFDDKRTGARLHNEMNEHEPVPVKKKRGFKFPDGQRCSYPKSPDCPIGHKANCFLPSVAVIPEGDVLAAYRYEYKGPIVKVMMEDGTVFECTPHHPMMTPSGWTASVNLSPGDSVCIGRTAGAAKARPIAELFANALSYQFAHVNKAVVDFHGDIAKDVDIILPNRNWPILPYCQKPVPMRESKLIPHGLVSIVVASTETRQYCGDVYNLETTSGYYMMSNGAIAKNCRCTTTPIVREP